MNSRFENLNKCVLLNKVCFCIEVIRSLFFCSSTLFSNWYSINFQNIKITKHSTISTLCSETEYTLDFCTHPMMQVPYLRHSLQYYLQVSPDDDASKWHKMDF